MTLNYDYKYTSYDPPPLKSDADNITFRIVRIDADVDSNNDGCVDTMYEEQEDQIEDATNLPGVLIPLNNSDDLKPLHVKIAQPLALGKTLGDSYIRIRYPSIDSEPTGKIKIWRVSGGVMSLLPPGDYPHRNWDLGRGLMIPGCLSRVPRSAIPLAMFGSNSVWIRMGLTVQPSTNTGLRPRNGGRLRSGHRQRQ